MFNKAFVDNFQIKTFSEKMEHVILFCLERMIYCILFYLFLTLLVLLHVSEYGLEIIKYTSLVISCETVFAPGCTVTVGSLENCFTASLFF